MDSLGTIFIFVSCVRVLIKIFVFINTRRGIFTALLDYSRNITILSGKVSTDLRAESC